MLEIPWRALKVNGGAVEVAGRYVITDRAQYYREASNLLK
jgi:hypothetical protein